MSTRPQNSFLQRLHESSYLELQKHLVPVDLPLGSILYHPGDKVGSVYFPVSCLLSLLTESLDGQSVETAMVGKEGAAGLIEACGSGRTNLQFLVQIDGRALKAPAKIIRALAGRDEDFSAHAWSLAEFHVAESRQSGMCNALHPVESRLARWLLESDERSGGRDPLPLTQEFLAAMLGVQRTTVNAFASQLQKVGIIRYGRGRITIVDIKGLEHAACECRAATKAQRDRLGFQVFPSGLSGQAHPGD